MPQLGSMGEVGFKKKVYSFLEAEGLTQLDSRECHYRIVSSTPFVNMVLPREVAQAVKGSNGTRFYGVGSGDVGKELPRNKSVLCVLFVDGLAQKHRRKRFQDACSFRG